MIGGIKELAAALAKAQAAFPKIERDRTVKVQTKTGGSYSFNYAPLDIILEKVRPALAENGLSISQALSTGEGSQPYALRTMLLHSSGEAIVDTMPLPAAPLTAPQELGGIITYCRRYAIVAILGIATEEDDEATVAKRRAKSAGESTRKPAPRGKAADKGSERSEDAPKPSPAEDTPKSSFKAPTGPRGGQSAQIEADEIAAEVRQLVEELGATDSLPSVEEHRLAADVTWLKKQRARCVSAIEARAKAANS